MLENPIPTTAEADLAEHYGVPIKVLAALRNRHLTEEAHWQKNGRAIHYTAAGLVELALHMQAPEALPLVPAAPPITARLVIVKCRFTNPKLVLAKKSGEPAAPGEPEPAPEIVRVKVRSSLKMRPGMVLNPCEPLDLENGYWVFRGKLPRNRRAAL
jgi:hypothetical protein